MLLQRLATGATGVKQARYTGCTGEGLLGAARPLVRAPSVCRCVAAVECETCI